MNLFENQQRKALSRMKSQRTCPPADILVKGGEQILLHLIFCDRCRKFLRMAKCINFENDPQIKKTSAKTIFKGAICQIVRDFDLDIYNDGKWFTPPMVAVCQEISQNVKSQKVLVAILHDAIELAADGDIILNGENSGWFLESWNTFHINTSWLDYLGVQMNDSEICEFDSKQKDTISNEYDSIIINEFRKQELEIAQFYSKKCCLEKNFRIQTFIDTEIIKLLDNDDIAMAALSEYESPLDQFPELGTISGRVIIVNNENITIRPEKFIYINGRLSTSIEWKHNYNFEIILLPQVTNKNVWLNAEFLISNKILMIYADFDTSIILTELKPIAIIKVL